MSFVGVGGLILVIGYLAPVPPSATQPRGAQMRLAWRNVVFASCLWATAVAAAETPRSADFALRYADDSG